MRRFLLAVVILLAGCTHASMVATSSGAAAVTTTSVSVGAASTSGSTTWVLLGIILISAEAANPTRPLAERPPPLDTSRRVNEQDCTQPIVDASANLRCK